MTLTEIPAELHLPKTATPSRDEVIQNIEHNANRLAIVYRGHRSVPVRRSSTHWARSTVRKTYMRVVTYEARFDEEGNFNRWVTINRKTFNL